MPNVTPGSSTAASFTSAQQPTAQVESNPTGNDPVIDPKARKPETTQAIPTNLTQTPEAAERAAVNQGEAAIRKLKLKVDGQEFELPESEVVSRAQRSTAADKRFAEAQQARAQAEQFVNLLKTDFTKLLDHPGLGLDEKSKRAMLEQYYKQKYIDPEVMTPEQRAQAVRDQELENYRQKEKREADEKHQNSLKQLEDFHLDNYQKIVIQALQTEGLPKTEFTVRRMADLMAKNLQLGLDLSAEHVATLVREDYQNETKALYSAADGETLLKILGDDIANKIRKADLQRLRAGQPIVPAPVIETPKTNRQEPRKYHSLDEERTQRDKRVAELQAGWKK